MVFLIRPLPKKQRFQTTKIARKNISTINFKGIIKKLNLAFFTF